MPTTTVYFVDSNVFIYAIGREHPLKAPCRQVFRRWSEAGLALLTGSVVIHEVAGYLVRRRARPEALAALQRLVAADVAVLHPSHEALEHAARLVTEDASLGWFDAVHAATALSADVHHIISADRDFDRIPGVERVDPRSL